MEFKNHIKELAGKLEGKGLNKENALKAAKGHYKSVLDHLSGVSGGLAVGGSATSGGNMSLEDNSRTTQTDNSNVSQKSTNITTTIDTDVSVV